MPRYNVEADGKWACFSSITDSFVTKFVDKTEYEKWRKEEYGKGCIPLGDANQMSLKKAIFSISLNRTDEEIIQELRFAGLLYDGKES